MAEVGRRALQARAVNAVAHTRSLAAREPAWGSEVHPFAGGWLVLAGRGLYVNQAMDAGVEVAISSSDLDLLSLRSEAVGVPATIEVTRFTGAANTGRIAERGLIHDEQADITVLARPSGGAVGPEVEDDLAGADAGIVVRAVTSEAELRVWQHVSSRGWGHTAAKAQRANDAFAAAANALDNEHLMVAFDPVDDRPLGCASITVRDGVATLGGMSTLPAERRRGVQSALIVHRVSVARSLGCDLAIATAVAGGASERNLQRHGFERTLTIETHTAAEPT